MERASRTSCQTRTSTLAVVSVAGSGVGSGGSSCAMAPVPTMAAASVASSVPAIQPFMATFSGPQEKAPRATQVVIATKRPPDCALAGGVSPGLRSAQ